MIGFRDHLGLDWPSDNAFLAGVERLLNDRESELLLGSPHDDATPGGVVQLRYRWGIWRAEVVDHQRGSGSLVLRLLDEPADESSPSGDDGDVAAMTEVDGRGSQPAGRR